MTTNGPYMAIGDASEQGIGIDVIDISDPSNMQWICRIQTNHISYDINWNGNFLYDPSAYNGFYIYDISNFNNPILAYSGTGPYSIALADVAIRNNFGMFGGDEGMLIYDITDPYSPVLEFESNQLGFYRIILGNDIACIMRWTLDVAILNISQFDNPSEISRFGHPYVCDIAMDPAESYLYLTNWDNGLAIYDISNISSPQFISETPMPGRPLCLEVCVSKIYTNYVFIAAYTGGLWAVDVTDPYNPIPTAHYVPPDQSHSVISRQDLVYLTIPGRVLSFEFDPETGTIENGLNMPDRYL